MKFLIVIPAHNEENFIVSCLDSLHKQSFQDFLCVVINDGSTDKTKDVVEDFIRLKQSKFKLLNLSISKHEPGTKVIKTFYKGLDSIDWQNYDVICKYDADIIFPHNYLEIVNQVFFENQKAGLVSGLVYIKNTKQNLKTSNDDNSLNFSNENGDWIFENLSSKNHVRGPIKAYRKNCFVEMSGLRPILGWDNLDVMLAKKNDWEIVTIKDLWVKHLRPTAYQYQNQKAYKLGEYFYNIGLSFPLAVISSAKSSFKNKSLNEFFITTFSFLRQDQKRMLSYEEIKYVRNLRWKEIFKKFGL